MILSDERNKIKEKFDIWANEDCFGIKTPDVFLIWLLKNGFLDEERILKSIKSEVMVQR